MTTIELNGVTLILTEKTANAIQTELTREREEKRAERRHDWILWHWYARRWAMYGDQEAGSLFSDMYKDEHGCRPHMTQEEVTWWLGGRDCWLRHDSPECWEYRRMEARWARLK